MGNCINNINSTENKVVINAAELDFLLNSSYSSPDYNISEYDTDVDFKSVAPCNRQICTKLITLFMVLLGVSSFLGITGNCAVFYSILRKQKFLRPEVTFLFQFTLANLMFALTLPFFTAYASSGWQIGNTACKFIQGTHQAVISAAGITMALLASAYCFPEQMKKKAVLILVICSTWGIALLLLVLASKAYGVPETYGQLCILLRSPDLQLLHSVNVTSRMFTSSLVPFFSAAFLFWYAIHKIQDPLLKRQARFFACLMVIFAVLWTPFNVLSFISLQNTVSDCAQQKLVNLVLEVTRSISILYCCVTPALILIMNLHVRLYSDQKN
ncbi:C-C chemokine receptor type 5-like [Protopterus annectens]|uniref:C-C chemokine receptor type 5-like n=1 Tax=Protopterus annectens TaxID=7888 RepID=UPI001CFB7372|nr:C-C chemokine receptor type 5-like [Protopterus annectens]XP_043938480.1 C-C chemokine receptor type 5-like [Protopterus annectens]XP_043938481.1 C-C chemokine receptor type 5-like [Protopterus annectens]